MILSYSFPQFEQKIIDGEKIHTFRRDTANRWRTGLHIDHWMGSPRNPRSNPRKFWEDTSMGVQATRMARLTNGEHWILHPTPELQHRRVHELFVVIGGNLYVDEECLPIMENDGLTQGEFMDFFLPKAIDGLGHKDLCWVDSDTDKLSDGVWNGRLIHWTEKLY